MGGDVQHVRSKELLRRAIRGMDTCKGYFRRWVVMGNQGRSALYL